MLKRFEGREDLGKEGLYKTYFEPLGLDKSEVLKCLEEIELGYEIPPGVLRPEDSMSKLNERVPTKNPIEWFLWLGRNEFAADGLVEIGPHVDDVPPDAALAFHPFAASFAL